MTTESRAEGELDPRGEPRKGSLLPGLVAIAVYLLLVALQNIVGVVESRSHYVDLIFSVALIAAALGLMRLLRWAWALTLAAVVFREGILFWQYAAQHNSLILPLALLNLVFFFYLVRTEVRVRLR
jgi:hypothetical protein